MAFPQGNDSVVFEEKSRISTYLCWTPQTRIIVFSFALPLVFVYIYVYCKILYKVW